MPTFSQRLGLIPLIKHIQLDDIDDDLRNSLWTVFDAFVMEPLNIGPHYESEYFKDFVFHLWYSYFKQPVDRSPTSYEYLRVKLREYFFTSPWNKVYDLIDFSIENSDKNHVDKPNYEKSLNFVLERENSGYRIVNSKLSPISNELEVAEIEEALTNSNKYSSISNANIHLKNALICISNKENPDYRNSIKESISAVETTVRILTNESTLGEALKKLEGKGLKINNQLKESFSKIYNYTNDKNAGIRHAVVGNHEAPDYETAKYLLITSSAFINYLVGLAVKNKIFPDATLTHEEHD